MNKPVYSNLSILDLSKTGIIEFQYDYVKQRYDEKAKLYYVGTGSFIIHEKTSHINRDILEEIETGFEASNYELNIPLPKGKCKKVNGVV